MVKYKNMTDKMVLIRKDISNDKGEIIEYRFYDCNPGDVVDITDEQGKANNFMKLNVEIEPVNEEVKQKNIVATPELREKFKREDNEYAETLKNIRGIGKKTVEDILSKYGSEQKLREAIEAEEHLPFRNDVVNKLIRVFGE